MIKILIVIEEEEGIDFRAYSLQISNKPSDLTTHAELRLIDTNEEHHVENVAKSPSSTGFQANCRYATPRSVRPLESRQIFMN